MISEKQIKIFFLINIEDNHSRKWINHFIKKGYKAYCVSLPSRHVEEMKNAEIYLLNDFRSKPLNIILNLQKVKKLLREIKPDIVHSFYAGVNGSIGALSGFHPFLLTTFGSDIFEVPKSIIKRVLIKFALKRADLITCNGEPLKEEILKLGGNPQKIRFIYWATDVEKFQPSSKNKNLRKQLALDNSPTIISLRNFEPVYNIETLIKAIRLVLKEVPSAKFIIAGKGSEEKRLKEIVENAHMKENIRFVGWIKEDDVAQYLNLSDIYVSTSLSDGDLAQSTQQAMACEKPVIITDIQVNKDRIKDGENGLLFPQRDSKSLAKKIIFLVKNKKFCMKLGNNGRKTIKKKLNHHREMEKAEDLYKEIIFGKLSKNCEKR